MSDVNRRDMVRLAAGLAAGAGLASGVRASGQQSKEPKKPEAPEAKDSLLAMAVGNPQAFELGDPVTFRIEGDGYSRDLIVTTALDEQGKNVPVHLRSGTVRVFRADAGGDESAKQGWLRWRFHKMEGQIKLKTPGSIVMMVREGYNTVRCYEMTADLRC